MDFISTSAGGFASTILTVGCCLALAGSLLLLFVFSQNIFTKLPEWKWPTYSMAALFALSIVSLLGYGLLNIGESKRVTSEISREAESAYGLELTPSEIIKELNYPEERPERELQVFGSIERDGEEIYLVWEDSKMMLATLESADSFVEVSKR